MKKRTAILAICTSLLLAAAGVTTYASQAAQGQVQRDAHGTSFDDARLTDGLSPLK